MERSIVSLLPHYVVIWLFNLTTEELIKLTESLEQIREHGTFPRLIMLWLDYLT